MNASSSIIGRVGTVAAVVLFVQCSSTGNNDSSSGSGSGDPLPTPMDDGGPAADGSVPADDGDAAPPPDATPDDGPAPPPVPKANVVFVLADDLSWNLVQYMPHVVQMQKDGMTFSKYFVTDSLCCPSRSSILTGKFPHGTGVFTNTGTEGGYGAFMANGNETKTFGTTLHADGYATGFMGKYLNGYDAETTAKIPGWTTWSLTAEGYKGFDYTLNENGTPTPYGSTPPEYLTDVIAAQGVAFVQKHAGKESFLIELASFAPHAPYVPAPRDENLFPGLQVPRGGAYGARPDSFSPKWLQDIPALGADKDQLDADFQKRAQAVQAIDDMIGKMQAAVAAAGQTKNTYFIFSSDNGFHMGEHSLRAGKQTAFDTDIRVPLIVVGPGVPAGSVREDIAENVDLCATFAELGQTPAPTGQMGRSLVSVLHGQTPADWRNVALVEHRRPGYDPNDPDNQGVFSANPPTYNALRTASTVYVEYVGGDLEYYDHATDPDELHNTATMLPAAKQQALHQTLDAMTKCSDAASCWAAQHMP